ncbi:MAG: asparagine synthase (glutamine-hydrolyzing) [Gemmatimonadaceae bacterium]
MCGIGGLVGKGWALDGERGGSMGRVLRRLLAPVRHRGPDDEGYLILGRRGCPPLLYGGEDTPSAVYHHQGASQPIGALPRELPPESRVGLAHRRLSILDVSPSGHQPMASIDGRRWIVFNGEIFNYLELRATLEIAGHRFSSHSDTEVILAAYAEWGEDCLRQFNGMFAFLLLDLARDELFVARDRFGVKPLYFRIVEGRRIAFSSEIKQLLAIDRSAPRLNPQRVYDFLVWSVSDHTDETMFEGVSQLPPGSCMTLPLDEAQLARTLTHPPVRLWYELRPSQSPAGRGEAIAEWGALLQDSVRLHLRSDVPVGSCLSGGLDSSSIVCLVHRELQLTPGAPQQRVFTAVAEEAALDERKWADAVVESTGVASWSVRPDADGLLDSLDKLTWHQDEPFGSTSIYAQWSVFALAAHHGVRVMLDGQGADEQLGGYHGFFAARHAQLLAGGRMRSLRHEMAEGRRLHGHTLTQQVMQMSNLLLPEGIRQQFRRWSGHATLRPDWLDLRRLGAVPRDPLQAMGALSPDVRQMSLTQLTRSNLQMLLHWEDRDSMAHSIEARVPFLDHRLVERTLGLADDLKVSDGITKRVLREAMTGILPESVRTRVSKLGFATPEESWITGPARETFRKLLRFAVDRAGGMLTERVLRRCDDVLERRAPFSYLPWRVISLGAWMRRFDVQS